MTRVLVLDDNAFVREMVCRQLIELEVDAVLSAGTAAEALGLLSGPTPVDLVICDLQMPDQDGIDFIRQLKRVNSKVSLAVLSGQDDAILSAAEKVAEGYGFHVVGNLSKPASLNDLKLVLDRTTGEKAAKRQYEAAKVTAEQIRDGLERGEFCCHYQPIVEIPSCRPVAVEALARWTPEGRSPVPPFAFIDEAECTGQIEELTNLLFEVALKDLAKLHQDGVDCDLAFNLSNRVLGHHELPAELVKSCGNHGVDPRRIILEITETSLDDDDNLTLDVVTRFRLKQFQLAIDDFGTGFSNLERLSRLPFSLLKIDCSFLWDSRKGRKPAKILESTCRMAKEMGLTTVVEGVEDEAYRDYVCALGVEKAQGYYFAKPLPRDELVKWWRNATD